MLSWKQNIHSRTYVSFGDKNIVVAGRDHVEREKALSDFVTCLVRRKESLSFLLFFKFNFECKAGDRWRLWTGIAGTEPLSE